MKVHAVEKKEKKTTGTGTTASLYHIIQIRNLSRISFLTALGANNVGTRKAVLFTSENLHRGKTLDCTKTSEARSVFVTTGNSTGVPPPLGNSTKKCLLFLFTAESEDMCTYPRSGQMGSKMAGFGLNGLHRLLDQ